MEHALHRGPAALDPLLHVVLVEPQIPANTGNAARTCAALGSTLHIVGQAGFTLTDAALRRAGLDYWPAVDLHWHPTLAALRDVVTAGRWYCFTARARRLFSDVAVSRGDVLVFGREDVGLPEELLDAHDEHCVRLPIREAVRSLNLSTCVGVASYQALAKIAAGTPP